jgi:hypothetical protein
MVFSREKKYSRDHDKALLYNVCDSEVEKALVRRFIMSRKTTIMDRENKVKAK